MGNDKKLFLQLRHQERSHYDAHQRYEGGKLGKRGQFPSDTTRAIFVIVGLESNQKIQKVSLPLRELGTRGDEEDRQIISEGAHYIIKNREAFLKGLQGTTLKCDIERVLAAIEEVIDPEKADRYQKIKIKRTMVLVEAETDPELSDYQVNDSTKRQLFAQQKKKQQKAALIIEKEEYGSMSLLEIEIKLENHLKNGYLGNEKHGADRKEGVLGGVILGIKRESYYFLKDRGLDPLVKEHTALAKRVIEKIKREIQAE